MTYTIAQLIKGEDLQAYAAMLMDHGFTIRTFAPKLNVHGVPIPHAWFEYERDGYRGHVERTDFDGYRHSMPIKPSREYGSSTITNPESHKWELRLEDAERTAVPEFRAIVNYGTKRNPVYPVFKNQPRESDWHAMTYVTLEG